MTKTLTGQWRDGTLPDDTYYWKICKENWIADKYEMYDYTKVCDVNKIECLAPVPSYEEYRELLDLNVYEKDRKKVMGLEDKVERLQEQKQKVIALIKDGRFVEALQELEK